MPMSSSSTGWRPWRCWTGCVRVSRSSTSPRSRVGGSRPRRRSTTSWSVGRVRVGSWSGSRAGTRSCSDAAWRRSSRAQEAGVPVEVIPGVSSAIAAPELAGIPLTHRGISQGFTVVTGHAAPDDPRSTLDWDALARGGTTLVVLMGVETLRSIVGALVGAGRDQDTPLACCHGRGSAQPERSSSPLWPRSPSQARRPSCVLLP